VCNQINITNPGFLFLPRQTDNAERTNTLPPPELNPLINPVLGQNMGRWAEVYFNSPPERRDEAVLRLLRELESEGFQHKRSLHEDSAPPSPALDRLRCRSCGRDNPAQHKFCGMCGLSLENLSATATLSASDLAAEDSAPPALRVDHLQVDDFRGDDLRGDDFRGDDLRRDDFRIGNLRVLADLSQPAPPWPAPDVDLPPMANPSDERTVAPDYFPLFPSDRESRSIDNDEVAATPVEERRSPSYRFYVGLVLVLVATALIYLAWRGSEVTTDNSPAPSNPVTTNPIPNHPTPTKSPEAHPALANPASVVVPHDPPKPVTNQPQTQPVSDRLLQTAPPAVALRPNTTPSKPTPVSGSAEFAVAQDFLNGTNGRERNREQAVSWLWEAVSKRNTAAALALSDMYLKGDGVPKNCDQARVLLDAAARKGMKEAGERLRHLQAFGCE
jgi:hypothetical protein